jgi:tryptophan synthase alpha chain
MAVSRLAAAFERARHENRAAFVAYVMAGDPDVPATHDILDALVAAGTDVIELGFPFTDPMADGLSVQKAGLRALASGTTLTSTLDMVCAFRARHPDTALIVMGYLNPVESMGPGVFAERAAKAGLDGAIIVDVPPEEADELGAAMEAADLALIRLATPTTDAARLPTVVEGVRGFVYFVSVAGITGDKAIQTGDIAAQVAAVRSASGLPVAVGFGIRTPEAAARTALIGDGVVVGSAIVDVIAKAHEEGRNPAADVQAFVSGLVQAVRSARHGEAA